jgi:hypothetical protein
MDARDEGAATAARRVADRALVLLFVIGIAAPCLGTLAGLATGGIPGENRTMAPPPKPFERPLKMVPRQIDAWFDDHFGFRNTLLVAHSRIAYAVFGVSSSRDVVLGDDGWLFYAADRLIENRRGLVPFTSEELHGWQARLEERRDWLAARGIRYVFVIAPEKSSVYAEHLPAALQPVREATRADQLVAWMREHSTVEVVDPRADLRAAKATDRLYHRTDTHWNDVGAFTAYHRVAEWLRAQFPAVQPIEVTQLDRQVHVTPGGDLAGMLALMPYFTEERIALAPKTLAPLETLSLTAIMQRRTYLPTHEPRIYAFPAGELGRAVVVHDSFFQAVQPFLARHFRRSTFVRWDFAPDIIADERPDVVIEEMIERVLSRPGFLPASEIHSPGVTATSRAP